MPKDHKQSTPRAGEGLPAGAARLGRAALQNHLLELQDALVDVEGVRHDDGVRDALPVVLSERASAAGRYLVLSRVVCLAATRASCRRKRAGRCGGAG